MKKFLALSALMLVLAAPSYAGLDLGWDDCITDPLGSSDVTFDCGNFASHLMFGNFQLDNPVDRFIALDFSIDVQTTTDPSGDFWNFSGAECNDGALTLAIGKLGNCDNSSAMACFATGAQCTAGFAWASNFNAATNRHRLVGSLFRDSTAPVALAAATDYFAFKFEFFTFNADDQGGACSGCTDPVAIVWNSATAFNAPPPGPGTATSDEEPITGPGLVDNCSTINGGSSLCGATPTQNKTWGQVKSLYR